MKTYGNLDFLLNEGVQFAFETYDGSTTPFPTAKVGRVIFRTDDLQVYVCVATNPDTWQPVIKVANSYTFNQTTASTTWTISHSLNTSNVLVQVYDDNDEKVIPDSIDITDANTVTITFNPGMTGKAVIVAIDTNIGTFVQHNSLSKDVLQSGQEITSVTYNTSDKPTQVVYGDGTTALISYVASGNNGEGEVEFIEFKNSSNVTIEKWQYTYNSNDLLASTTRLV